MGLGGFVTTSLFFSRILGIFRRVPWQVWAGLALLAAWYWERDNYGDRREEAGRAAVQAQWDAARAAAKAASDRIAKANTTATEKANTDVTENLAREGAGADAFIARGGVRPCPARTNPAAQGGSAAVDAGSGALPVMDDVPAVVTVLPEDVRICTENTVKAQAWREWGLAIEANQTPEKP